MTVAIYVRISQDTTLTRAGVERQRVDCEKLCKANRWGPTRVYEDNDVSAFSGRRRPAYQQMLADVAAGDVGRIVAWHPDRLHRSPRELEDFIELVEATGCEISTVTAGQYDLSTSAGRQTARIIGAVARGESEHKSERIRRAHLQLAENGERHGGGSRPFGYRRAPGPGGRLQLVVDPVEADVVRELMDRYLAGQSARALAADLRDREIPTVSKGTWRTNTVIGMLTGAVLSGQREHHGEIVAAGSWPAIVTPEQTRNARAIAAMNGDGKSGPRDAGANLVAGICRCGVCGARMHSAKSKGKPTVRCSPPPNGNACVSMLRAPLEALIEEMVFGATDSARIPATAAADRLAARTVRDAEQKLAELADAYADNVISIDQLRRSSERIRSTVVDATSNAAATGMRDAAIRPFVGKPGALRKAWAAGELPPGQRQAIVRALIDTITIGPGLRGRKTFDPDRVDVAWRV